ncbi:MAG: DUF3160 domain-containing protein [Synergistaceae bacterium]|jgi:hypothetical protein|nr:DUF3160 domain-containing protein [Synergistaceae bacterium]
MFPDNVPARFKIFTLQTFDFKMVSLIRGGVFVLTAALFCVSLCEDVWAASSGHAAGEYTVTAEVLPIMIAPGAKYTITDGEVEYSENVWGVVVYGNRLELRPSGLKGWSGLLSPEDGAVLGYVETSGVEKFPEYDKTEVRYYMAAKDSPELVLLPGGKGKKNNLSSYGYRLLKGEVVPSEGEIGEILLLGFETDYTTGDGGIGGRYVWGRKKDFIALYSYEPDNGRLDPKRLPSDVRKGPERETGGDGGVLKIPAGLLGRISKRGFAIDPAPVIREYLAVDDMADSYNETGDYEVDFITTDIFLHSFHLLFDHTLQKLERIYLASALESGLKNAMIELEKMKSGLPDGAMTSYETARDMFSVAHALLTGDSNGLSSAAAEELRRVLEAGESAKSGLTGQPIDYTAFKPRGHYTLTPKFERYFCAMGYIGSAELPLFDAKTRRPITRNVRTAALISLVLDALGKSWEAFEEPIGFLVGVPNSGSPQMFRALVRKHIGEPGEAKGYKNLSDGAKISSLAEDIASAIKGPAIQAGVGIDKEDSDFENRLPVFRISGKRFTWDAYAMNRLTSPRVGTDELPRNIPEGTDVMAVLGSGTADEYARKNDSVKGYRKNLDALRAETPKYLSKENTVYSKWLSAFAAGFKLSGSDQFFYNDPSWGWKKVNTHLASWAELKHDTILYAEQSAAEMGAGGDLYAGRFAPPNPRGCVEPDPQVFDALLAAVEELRVFVRKYAMEPPLSDEDDFYTSSDNYGNKLDLFAQLLTSARDIAQKEVSGAELTPEDYKEIKTLARSFRGNILLPGTGEFFGDNVYEQLKMALVADVATNGWDKTALEAATGTPRKIYVFVNDKSGGARLARGYVYSYYEFERPLSDGRMTDEEWKKIVYDKDRANELEELRPDWYRELEK